MWSKTITFACTKKDRKNESKRDYLERGKCFAT